MTVADWLKHAPIGADSNLLLQMDIEGYEYETLLSMPDDLLKRFRIIVIEFHRLHHLWSAPFFRLAASAFANLLQTHSCVHLHPSNSRTSIYLQGVEIPPLEILPWRSPRLMEFTFYRNDRFKPTGYARRFPHPLDRDNTAKAPVALPADWYGQPN